MKKIEIHGGERGKRDRPGGFTFRYDSYKMNTVFCLLRQGSGLEASAAACPKA